MCMQFDIYLSKKIVGSEDCLYLNIFVPQVVEIFYYLVWIVGYLIINCFYCNLTGGSS